MVGVMEDELKTREQWLREEVKNHRALLLSLLQWGMAILATVESSLYFIRRDLAQAILGKPFVIPAQAFSFWHWCFGTSVLFLIVLLFTMFYLNLLKRYTSYREQLNLIAPTYSKISDGEVKTSLQLVPLFFFWGFLLIDIGAWWAFHK
jgi:hypothetical protein